MCLNLFQRFAFSLGDKKDGEDDVEGAEAREHPERSCAGYEILRDYNKTTSLKITSKSLHFNSRI